MQVDKTSNAARQCSLLATTPFAAALPSDAAFIPFAFGFDFGLDFGFALGFTATPEAFSLAVPSRWLPLQLLFSASCWLVCGGC